MLPKVRSQLLNLNCRPPCAHRGADRSWKVGMATGISCPPSGRGFEEAPVPTVFHGS